MQEHEGDSDSTQCKPTQEQWKPLTKESEVPPLLKKTKTNRKRKQTSNMSKFVDFMTKEDQLSIDIALTKFSFACNIPFAVCESDHFKSFVTKLRPSYRSPYRARLSGTLLDEVYNMITEEDKNCLGKESILLINGWNSFSNTKNVVTMLQTTEGKVAFLDACDISEESETTEKLVEIENAAIPLARAKYNTNIFCVVSDNASNMVKCKSFLNYP